MNSTDPALTSLQFWIDVTVNVIFPRSHRDIVSGFVRLFYKIRFFHISTKNIIHF